MKEDRERKQMTRAALTNNDNNKRLRGTLECENDIRFQIRNLKRTQGGVLARALRGDTTHHSGPVFKVGRYVRLYGPLPGPPPRNSDCAAAGMASCQAKWGARNLIPAFPGVHKAT